MGSFEVPVNFSKGPLRFPPPRKQTHCFALVVEKKGDDSRTSMKQNEIYCFSPDIRMDSGVMLMPKDTWKHYEIGDWIYCEKLYVDRHDERQYQERELINIKYVEPKYHKNLGLPIVSVFATHAYILREFVVCPEFFKNRVKNIGGRFRKLILLDIGLGFVNLNRKNLYENLKPGIVYRGLFNFKSKNNGGVNFNTSETDSISHPLEMNSLWELEELVDYMHEAQTDHGIAVKSIKLQDCPKMKEYLDDVMEWAKIYARDFEPAILRSETRKSNLMAPPAKEIQNLNKTTHLTDFRTSNKIGDLRPSRTPQPPPLARKPIALVNPITARVTVPESSQLSSSRLSNNRAIDATFLEEQSQGSKKPDLDTPIFDRLRITDGSTNDQRISRGNAFRRRDNIIERSTFLGQDGTRVISYIDRETNERSDNKEELIKKYNERHSIIELDVKNSNSRDSMNCTLDDRVYSPPEHVCDDTFNVSTFPAAIMSSTPMTRSPERTRSMNRPALIKKENGSYYLLTSWKY